MAGGLIGSAHRGVLVEMYELGRPDIVRELGDAVGRGVAVRVITDPTVVASRRSASALDMLRVPERVYPVDDGRHQIDHVKVLIVDGVAAVGGMNWGKHSDRNHDYVLETHVVVDISRLVRIFEQDWSLAGGRPAPLAAKSSEIAQTAPGEEIRTMLEEALIHATRRALAEVYTLTDPEVTPHLLEAHPPAAVRPVLPTPNPPYNLHAYAVLKAGGVGVRGYPIPPPRLLHAQIRLS